MRAPLPLVVAWLTCAACEPKPGREASAPAAASAAPTADRPVRVARPGLTAPPLPSVVPSSGLTVPHTVVPVQPGDAEFHGGDSIEIVVVRGTVARLQAGELYEVEGRYRLRSHARATLLFSVTTSGAGGFGPTPPGSSEVIDRGDGSFTLRLRIVSEGQPHVTFYGDDGQPFGGVYFGHDAWLLEHKGWSYQASKTP